MKSKFIIILVCICIVGFAGYNYYESKKDYIDGNVLNLPFFTVESSKEGNIAPPWINNGLVYHLLFRPLIISNPELTEYKPALAESFSVSDDALVYTFKKRANLKWSDGVEITTDDIIFSIEAAMAAKVIDSIYAEAFRKIDSITVDESKTITITLFEEHSAFLHAISQFLILPKHLLSKDAAALHISEFWENPVGSGMYMLTEKTQDYYKLEKNPHFVGTEPKIETVLLHKTRETGLDYYLSTNIVDMVNLRAMRTLEEHKLPVEFYRYFTFNIEGNDGYTNPAMQDYNLRAAIASAINNQEILESVYLGMGTTFPLIDKHEFDTKKAKEYLLNSRYDIKRPLRLGTYYTDSNSLYFVQNVIQDLEDIGFHVELVKENSYADFLEKRNFDVLLKDLIVLDSRDWVLELSSRHSSARLYGGKGEVDNLLRELRQEFDKEKQQELINTIYVQATDYLYRYPLVSLSQMIYTSPRLVLPKNLSFGNPWYLLDMQFEDWEIKKQ